MFVQCLYTWKVCFFSAAITWHVNTHLLETFCVPKLHAWRHMVEVGSCWYVVNTSNIDHILYRVRLCFRGGRHVGEGWSAIKGFAGIVADGHGVACIYIQGG
jgi:hypothetical protein